MAVVHVDTNDLLRRYDAGESVLSMANSLRVSRPTIMRRLKSLGIKTRNGSESQIIRNSRLTPEQRLLFAQAAHNAVRGVKQSMEHRCKIAATREMLATAPQSVYEAQMREWLAESGITVTIQKAVGPYNIDLAITESRIAVEIFGGSWHNTGRHAARFRERMEYILGSGWIPVIVWACKGWKTVTWTRASADYIIALHDIRCSGEPVEHKEHVIRGDAYTTPVAKFKPHNGAIVLGVARGNERRDAKGSFC